MIQKMTSRKWIAMVVAVIYTMTASGGFDMPMDEVVVVDALMVFYIFVEGIVDMVRAKFSS